MTATRHIGAHRPLTRRLWPAALLVALLALAFLFLTPASPAQAKDWSIDRSRLHHGHPEER